MISARRLVPSVPQWLAMSSPATQLIPAGVSHSSAALPAVPGCKYVKGDHGTDAIGFRLVRVGTDQSLGLLERTWVGHFVQTPTHWANILTSHAILDFIIVPWLLAKKNALGLLPDHVCVLIVDCWYGWKDQDKGKTLQKFPDYVRERYPWLKLLFVPAACTDLVQPADRGAGCVAERSHASHIQRRACS